MMSRRQHHQLAALILRLLPKVFTQNLNLIRNAKVSQTCSSVATKRVCPSVRPSAIPSVHPSVFFLSARRGYIRPSLRPSVPSSVRPSLRPFIIQSFRTSVPPSVHHPVITSPRPSIRLSVCSSVRPPVRLFVRPSICLSVYPSVCPSVRPSVCESLFGLLGVTHGFFVISAERIEGIDVREVKKSDWSTMRSRLFK